MENELYFKASTVPLANGVALNGFAQDAGLLHMAKRAYINGLPHLETLLHADWLDAVRTGRPQNRLLAIPVIEAIFEVERERHFPDRPSRLGNVLLFRTIEAAIAFANAYRQGYSLIYACRIDQGEALHTHMEWINPGLQVNADLDREVQSIRERTRSYWLPEEPPYSEFPETIVAGRVTVVGLVASVTAGLVLHGNSSGIELS